MNKENLPSVEQFRKIVLIIEDTDTAEDVDKLKHDYVYSMGEVLVSWLCQEGIVYIIKCKDGTPTFEEKIDVLPENK